MYSILIVDDEPIVKIALRSILPWEEHGFSICGTASNGLEALPLINQHHPDVIITDLKMPGMDGLELIRILKEQGYPGEILVLSNYEDFDSVRSALLLGAADYLLKIKIQPDTLLSCLNKTVEKLKDRAPSHWEPEKRIRKRICKHCCWNFSGRMQSFQILLLSTTKPDLRLCKLPVPSAL